MKNKSLIRKSVQNKDETFYEIVRPDGTQTFYFRINPFSEMHERGLDIIVGTLGKEFETTRIEFRDIDGDKNKCIARIVFNELDAHAWVTLLHRKEDA